MTDQFILTPWFLDEAREGLTEVAGADWVVNRPTLPEGERQTRMSALHEPLAGFVADALRDRKRPVSVAGDCCATIGVAAGLQRAGVNPALLWLDAHGDFNTWETTPSKFLGGMPLAMIVGRGDLRMPKAVGLSSFDESRIVLADARDLDPGEKIALDYSKVRRVSNLDALSHDERLNGPIWVHFDTDVVNPLDAPAQSWAAPGGPRADEVRDFFRKLTKSKEIVAISMCGWNPALDTDGRTRSVSMELLGELTRHV